MLMLNSSQHPFIIGVYLSYIPVFCIKTPFIFLNWPYLSLKDEAHEADM